LKKFLAIMLVMIIPFVALVSCDLIGEAANEAELEAEVEAETKESEWESVLAGDGGEVTNGSLQEPENAQILERLPRQRAGYNNLIGTWLWESGPSVYLYVFEDDESGIRGFFCDGLDSNFVPEVESFEWMVRDGILILDFGEENIELWSIEISNDILALTSEQIVDLKYTYVRLIEEVYDELVGVWNWAEDISWFYEFYPSGRGSRPAFPAGREEFDWAITADEGLIMFVDDGLTEVWSFVVQEDVLTITSRQVAGLEYIYILNCDSRW
jgi:hypothetical protein